MNDNHAPQHDKGGWNFLTISGAVRPAHKKDLISEFIKFSFFT